MSISKSVRDRLLVEAGHRCTICTEKCFEIHHIIEKAKRDPEQDQEDNLIVMCPNCHQHRYHRCGEFTPDQLRMYKEKLKEKNEIERRLLMNLKEIKKEIGTKTSRELEAELLNKLQEASSVLNPTCSPVVTDTILETAKNLAERGELTDGARKAIEVKYEVERAEAKAKFPTIEVVGVDKAAYCKSNDFPSAYKFVLILNHTPHIDWRALFRRNYETSFYMMKRKTSIDGDRIKMIVADSDDLQKHVDFAKRLVKETNDLVQQQGFQDIDRQINEAKQKALAEYDAIQSMKKRTEDLKI